MNEKKEVFNVVEHQKNGFLVSLDLSVSYMQLVYGIEEEEAIDQLKGVWEQGNFKNGLVEVIDHETMAIEKGIIKKIATKGIFFPYREVGRWDGYFYFSKWGKTKREI